MRLERVWFFSMVGVALVVICVKVIAVVVLIWSWRRCERRIGLDLIDRLDVVTLGSFYLAVNIRCNSK